MPAAYTTAHGNPRSLTHRARSGIEPTTSWFLVRFVSAVPQQELLLIHLFLLLLLLLLFLLFRATLEAHGGSQARDTIGAVAAGHSHSYTGSEPSL